MAANMNLHDMTDLCIPFLDFELAVDVRVSVSLLYGPRETEAMRQRDVQRCITACVVASSVCRPAVSGPHNNMKVRREPQM